PHKKVQSFLLKYQHLFYSKPSIYFPFVSPFKFRHSQIIVNSLFKIITFQSPLFKKGIYLSYHHYYILINLSKFMLLTKQVHRDIVTYPETDCKEWFTLC